MLNPLIFVDFLDGSVIRVWLLFLANGDIELFDYFLILEFFKYLVFVYNFFGSLTDSSNFFFRGSLRLSIIYKTRSGFLDKAAPSRCSKNY